MAEDNDILTAHHNYKAKNIFKKYPMALGGLK
jgi:hypothetical protein